MAERCPESRYNGTAQLRDYRFQINQRGYANIVPSRGDCVEGLVYLLSLSDEAKVDRNEGVPIAYQKLYLSIEVSKAAIDYVGCRVSELALQLAGLELDTAKAEASAASRKGVTESFCDFKKVSSEQRSVWSSTSSKFLYLARGCKEYVSNKKGGVKGNETTGKEYSSSGLAGACYVKGQPTEALVYVSANFTKDSEPRDEYIDRMNAGIIDARKLGLSETYIDNCLRPYIPDRAAQRRTVISQSRKIREVI
ncbi:MAG: hypothetical protein Q9190_005313 [Brigantiaea leucoxantha]